MDKKESEYYLELYGSDFDRWPVAVSEAMKREIQSRVSFAEAQATDDILAATAWPAFDRTAMAARLQEQIAGAEHIMAQHLPVLFVFRRPAVFFTMLAFFVFCGLTSGWVMTADGYNASVDAGSYSYFTSGVDYAYSGVSGEETDGGA